MDQKPKSMQSGSRNILRPNDSLSLWNYTLSPGWTLAESEMLRKAILKFGVGNWKDVLASGCLPGKTNAQINLQLQRMIGQQSTAEFQGIHLDPFVVGQENSKRQGVKRKNGCIVNTGNKMSRQELLERIQLNKKKYQVPESEWVDIVLEVGIDS
jgi:hypothetical protein